MTLEASNPHRGHRPVQYAGDHMCANRFPHFVGSSPRNATCTQDFLSLILTNLFTKSPANPGFRLSIS